MRVHIDIEGTTLSVTQNGETQKVEVEKGVALVITNLINGTKQCQQLLTQAHQLIDELLAEADENGHELKEEIRSYLHG